MNLLFLAIYVIDGLVVGGLLSVICEGVLGNKPAARLLKLVVSVAGGVAYSIWGITVANSDKGTMAGFLILTFAPIALILILWVLNYMFNNSNGK